MSGQLYLSDGQAKLLSFSMASRGTIDCMHGVEAKTTEKCQPSQSQGISVIFLPKISPKSSN